MMGFISDKTLVNGVAWENLKNEMNPDFGEDEELYNALRAVDKPVLLPTPYNQYTNESCSIDYKINATIENDSFEIAAGTIIVFSECINLEKIASNDSSLWWTWDLEV